MLVLGRPLSRVIPWVEEEVRGAGRVLEVAAGTGLVTVALGRVAQHVVATDYSSAMLDELRARIDREGVRNVECVERDVYDLKLDRGSFDAVVCANVLHLVPDLERAIAAMKEVLRPGGKLIAPTFVHDETVLSRAVSRLLAMTGFPGLRRFTAASLRGAIEKAGVDVYRSETVSGVLPVCFVAGSPADQATPRASLRAMAQSRP